MSTTKDQRCYNTYLLHDGGGVAVSVGLFMLRWGNMNIPIPETTEHYFLPTCNAGVGAGRRHIQAIQHDPENETRSPDCNLLWAETV